MTRELPNNIPYPAKVELIRISQSTWEAKSRSCFEGVYKEFNETVMHLIETKFSRYENLKTRVRYVYRRWSAPSAHFGPDWLYWI